MDTTHYMVHKYPKHVLKPLNCVMARANSTSTIHVDGTMSHPDNTIVFKEISKILYKEITQGDLFLKNTEQLPDSQYIFQDVHKLDHAISFSESPRSQSSFNDERKVNDCDTDSPLPHSSTKKQVLHSNFEQYKPSVERLADFLHKIYETAQCSEECSIVCLIYIQRLINIGGIKLTTVNWRPVVGLAMLLASKVWDDLSMINEDFSVFLEYDLDIINEWEVQFLNLLKYNVRVSASEYAATYFELRRNSGKGKMERLHTQTELDRHSAEKLEFLSSSMEGRLKEMRHPKHKNLIRRSLSHAEDYIEPRDTSDEDIKLPVRRGSLQRYVLD